MKRLIAYFLLFAPVLLFSQTKVILTPGSGSASGSVKKVNLISTAGAASGTVTKVTLTRDLINSVNVFSFVLTDSVNTSAGIFTADSFLLRTLWSGKRYGPGTYYVQWDGYKDDSTLLSPSTNYHVELLKHNVTTTWNARIGNTSTALTGSTKHRAEGSVCMAIMGDKLYYGTQYGEGYTTQYQSNVSNPQQRTGVGPNGSTNQGTQFICSDSILTYWGGYDPGQGSGPTETFVYASNWSNNVRKDNFTYGTVAVMGIGITYPSVIAHDTSYNNYLSGMAVQKHHNYLFVSRNGKNELTVVNKTTGATVQTITVAGIKKMAVDTSDKLWITTNTTATKYNVNSDGTLTSTGTTITGFQSMCAIAVSPDNSLVLIGDDSTSLQVIKTFNNSSGGSTPLWTLGTPGGYVTNAAATNYKFFWRDTRTNYLTDIAFQDDGSFWVVDGGGNSRMQHYSASRTFIDRIMYIPSTYVVQTDKNNPTRIFANYLEFSRNYSIPAGTANGSWELAANWGGNVPDGLIGEERISSPITLSNGKTYYKARSSVDPNTFPIMELVPNGVIRPTGIVFDSRNYMNKDGSRWANPEGTATGLNSHIYRYPLTGFSGTYNDPQWSGSYTTLATTPPLTVKDPVPSTAMYQITASDIIPFFNADKTYEGYGGDMHLGAIKKGDNKYLWKTSRGTTSFYGGDYPIDGSFDNYNGVIYAGGFMTVFDRYIIWSYHGEFYKQSQTNKFSMYYDNGLFVTTFGIISADFPGEEATYGGAGNALTGALDVVNGVAYLHHADESVNAGVGEWTIDNLSSVVLQKIMFNSSIPIPPDPPYLQLMKGLPFKGTLPVNVAGWTVSNLGNQNNHIDSIWSVSTGFESTDPFQPTDVYAFFLQPVGSPRTITRILGSNSGLSSWSLNGRITMNFANSPGNAGGAYVDVLDNNDLVIARFYESTDNADHWYVNGNDKILTNVDGTTRNRYTLKLNPFQISCSGGVFTFNYRTSTQTTTTLSNPSANWHNPSKLRLSFFTNNSGYANYGRAMGLKDLIFSKTQ